MSFRLRRSDFLITLEVFLCSQEYIVFSGLQGGLEGLLVNAMLFQTRIVHKDGESIHSGCGLNA